ncbi:MAG TPA: cation:proton antiporter, partial [Thermaerobacter sp.]
MAHDTELISTLAVALSLAFVAGFLARRVGLPPIVGYLLAGIAVGPFTPGFVADESLAGQLSEIGVILLMFGVGLHFSFRDLLAVRGIAIPGAVGQSSVATALGIALALAWGWGVGAGLVLGLAVSVASTVVLIRALMDLDALESVSGRVAVGWLVVEDLFTVLALVILPALAVPLEAPAAAAAGEEQHLLVTLGVTVAKLVALAVLMEFVGARTRWAAIFTGVLVGVLVALFLNVVSYAAMPALGALLIAASASTIQPAEVLS